MAHQTRTYPTPPLVLVVEDDPPLQDLLAAALRDAGYHPVVAPNGIAALDFLQTKQPALILLDIWMPAITGWEVLEELAKRNITTPVVVISADPRLPSDAQKYAVAAVLQKPFTLEALLAVLETYSPLPAA